MGADIIEPVVRANAPDAGCAEACLACGYDLTGLVSVSGATCPECGESFTREEIDLAHKPRAVGAVSTHWLTAFCVLVAVYVLWYVLRHPQRLEPGAPALVLWPVAILWGLVVRTEGRAALVRSFVAAAMMSTLIFFGWGHEVGIPADIVLVVNGTALAFWGLIWLCPPGSSAFAALLMLAIAPAPLGAALVLAGVGAYSGGYYWTNWDGLSGRALGRGDALVLGIELLGASGVLCVAAVAARVWLDGVGRKRSSASAAA